MKKICPYCGRVDDLGACCSGCGYVLQISDETAPSPADSSESSYSSSVSYTFVSSYSSEKQEPPKPITPKPIKKEPVVYKETPAPPVWEDKPEPSYTYTPPAQKEDAVSTVMKTAGIVILRIASWIIAVPAIILGTYFIFQHDMFKINTLFGISASLFGLFIALTAVTLLSCVHSKTWKRTGMKCLNYMMLPCFVLFILTFIISAFLF